MDNNKLKSPIKFKSRITPSEVIEIDHFNLDLKGRYQKTVTDTINTRDKLVQKRLIELGWTPPLRDNSETKRTLFNILYKLLTRKESKIHHYSQTAEFIRSLK